MSRSAALAVLAAFLLAPVPACALSLASDSIPVSLGSMLGTIEIVSFAQGEPAGAVPLAGAVAPSDWVLAFRIVLSPASVVIAGPGVFASDAAANGRTLTGGGTVPGADVSVVSASLAANLVPTLHFAWDGGTLEPGQTSDVLYAAWSDLAPGDFVGVLLGQPIPPGQMFGRRDAFHTRVVAEPVAALLLLPGLAALVRRS
jgi:hypothetical protein